MANAMLDARQEDGSYRRVELITGQRRRRRWTAEEKARIVAESFEEGANISEIARRHGVVRGLLTVWRVEGGWRPNARVRAGRDRCSGSADGGACKSRGDDMVQRPMPWPYRDRGLRGSERRAGCGPVEWLSPRSNRPSEVPAALTVCLLWNCVFEAYVCVHVLRNRTTKFARGLERWLPHLPNLPPGYRLQATSLKALGSASRNTGTPLLYWARNYLTVTEYFQITSALSANRSRSKWSFPIKPSTEV
jgi:Transposase